MPDDVGVFASTGGDPHGRVWPLTTVRDCFALLVAGPEPLAVDGSPFLGLPDRLVPLDELRDRLMASRCPQSTRDTAWALVIRRSREHGSAWTVGCAGMALPALASVAGRLSRYSAADPFDVHAEVLAGFLAAVTTARLDLPRIMVRLRWAAYRAGLAVVTQAREGPRPDSDLFDARGHVGESGTGHPDLVLVRAVADGVLTPAEVDLIGATRLDRVTVAAWAADRGTSARAAYVLRSRAEARLVAHLTGLDASLVSSRPAKAQPIASPANNATGPPARPHLVSPSASAPGTVSHPAAPRDALSPVTTLLGGPRPWV
ncbi:hypothetical protein I6A84_21725 [Frankia sp. CNm7]|uniref:Uncharacterized protein n=1 Tax=Frankia nepalensis TaxID=1836974 RepID=A0A937UNW7_9ACTN|nr:hypothetical protein [Frankia nepalensis]MBL7496184.1 hypothetical protein [Frankia nepalensis]MBL7511594.1 hypothetical protein [Frankia nepalensis]MBL7520636.1 hypothetical protein [Frankia nepalensis]MBL7630269.1 hypothetical protein [Frankia nepalensis]